MKELSTSARAHLDALRTVDAPPAEASTRVWEAVSTRAAAGELGPELPVEPSGVAGAGATTSIKAIGLGVLVGAGVAIAAAAALLGGGSPPVLAAAPGLVGLAELAQPEPSAPAPSEPVPLADDAVVEIAEAIATPSVEPALRTARGRTSPRTATARLPEAAETGATRDPVAEEVALLAEARSALGAGEASRAIGVLARHRKRFPEGLLARERDVSWITALCVLGRVDEARTKATSFLRAHGSSPHAAKVRASCGGRDE